MSRQKSRAKIDSVFVCQLATMGVKQGEIAEHLGFSRARVSQVLSECHWRPRTVEEALAMMAKQRDDKKMTAKNKISSISDLFEKFGGHAAVGRAIGVTTEHASLMKQRKSIPVARWQDVIKAASLAGIDLSSDDMLRLHSAPFCGEGEIEATQAATPVGGDKGQAIARAAR
jgi:predicted XRE-type DNA-binding protein